MKRTLHIVIMVISLTFLFATSVYANESECERISFSAVKSAASNGEICVIVGERGMVARSNDYENWTFVTIPDSTDINFTTVFCSPEKFYAVSSDGNYIYTSSDGLNWQQENHSLAAKIGVGYVLDNGNIAFKTNPGIISEVFELNIFDQELKFIQTTMSNKVTFEDWDIKGDIQRVSNDGLILSDGRHIKIADRGSQVVLIEERIETKEIVSTSGYPYPNVEKALVVPFNGEQYIYYARNGEFFYHKKYDEIYANIYPQLGSLLTEYVTNGEIYVAYTGQYLLIPPESFDKLDPNNAKMWGKIYIFNKESELINEIPFGGVITSVQYRDNDNSWVVDVGARVGNYHDYEYRRFRSYDLENWEDITDDFVTISGSGYLIEGKGTNDPVKSYSASNNWASLFGYSLYVTTYKPSVPIMSFIDVAWEDVDYFYFCCDEFIVKYQKEQFLTIVERLKNAPTIYVNNSCLIFETAPTIESGRTLVPMRFLFETLGADVNWNNETQTASVVKDDETVAFSINNTVAMVNGKPEVMDVPARLIDGKTFVPIRFLSESLGYDVEYDGENNTVIIHTEK